MNNLRATLRIPAYSGVSAATFMSVLREFDAWPGLDVDVIPGMANIDHARSRIASRFLERSEEETGKVLLMVDSDNAFRKGDLFHITQAALRTKAVVGGVYAKRIFNRGVALRIAQEGQHEIGTETLVACDYVGTGFIAIPREILEVLAQDLPVCQDGVRPFFMPFVREYNGRLEYPTDDAAFCARVHAAGYQVFASLYPHVTHEGNYVYRVQDGYIEPPPEQDITIAFEDVKVYA